MTLDQAEALARAPRAYLIAAAGCGKTEALAWAAGVHSEGRQLVLTHTHAGVKAVKDRLNRVSSDRGRVHVDTIAGFALRYAASFPQVSGLVTAEPATSEEWTAVYEAGRRIFGSKVGREVLARSFAGMFVDEYQDCVVPQHDLVMVMAEALPCRVVLDPLQGIFDFAGPIVSYEDHLAPAFDRLPDLTTPFRWIDTNPQLGEWLTDVRTRIEAGQPVDLNGAPVTQGEVSPVSQVKACFELAKRGGSAVAIGRWEGDTHAIAKRLKGVFTVMEPIECPDLLEWAARLEGSTGAARALAVIDFAKICMTQVGTQLQTAATAYRNGTTPVVRSTTRHREAVEALNIVVTNPALDHVLAAMTQVAAISDARMHRRELWRDMVRAIRTYAFESHQTLRDAAWRVRDRGRYGGRRVEHRTVSRTVLAKGLEFDHALVLDAEVHDGPNLYVALTRGSRSLTVLSADRLIATTNVAS
ncbi:MAG: hypothetical protein WD651_09610 [Acidimicrobiia bacterium]